MHFFKALSRGGTRYVIAIYAEYRAGSGRRSIVGSGGPTYSRFVRTVFMNVFMTTQLTVTGRRMVIRFLECQGREATFTRTDAAYLGTQHSATFLLYNTGMPVQYDHHKPCMVRHRTKLLLSEDYWHTAHYGHRL